MSKLFAWIILAAIAWVVYQRMSKHVAPVAKPRAVKRVRHLETQSNTRFHCDGRSYCSQMTSRA
jgi:hypothetical protein